MRVPEENCNMVLLATVTLFSVTVAAIAGWWQGTAVIPSQAATRPPVYIANRTAVRLVGAPFVPNVNPPIADVPIGRPNLKLTFAARPPVGDICPLACTTCC
jgi:hypothetical protein